MPAVGADPLLHLLAGRPARRLAIGAALPARPLPRPALDAGDAGDRRARRAAGAARGPRPPTASPTTSPLRHPSTRASRCCSILLAGTAVVARALRAPAAARGPRRRRAPAARVELSRDPTVLRGVAVGARRRRDRRRDRLRRPRLGPVLELRPRSSPPTPPSTSPTSPAPAATTSGGSRSTPSKKSRWLGHGAGTYEFSWDQLRSIDLTVIDAHSLYLEAFAELGLLGGLLVLGADRHAALVRLRRLARGLRPAARGLRGALRGDARLRDRAPASTGSGRSPGWAPSSSSPPGALVAARCAQLAPAGDGRPQGAAASASWSAASPSPGSRRSP